MEAILISGLVVGAVSAIRGIWSPCGLSMLSSITPMTEAGRGNRFGVTAAWFLAGGVAGGLAIGSLAAGGAALLSLADLDVSVRWALAAVAAAITASIDLGVAGIELPIFKRQVNDAWLRRYRSWVYGAGFGAQIGFGLATYIMTAGVFLTIALAVLTASPAAALLVGAAFGLVRGSAVYVGRSGTTPAALGAIHDRLDRLAPASRLAAASVQVLAATLMAGLAWGALAAVATVALAAVAAAITGRAHPRRTATA